MSVAAKLAAKSSAPTGTGLACGGGAAAPSTPPPLTILGALLVADLDGDFITAGDPGQAAAMVDQGAVGTNTPVMADTGAQPLVVANAVNGHAALLFEAGRFLYLENTFTGLEVGDKPVLYAVLSWTESAPNESTGSAFLLSNTGSVNEVLELHHKDADVRARSWLGAGGTQSQALLAGHTAITVPKLYRVGIVGNRTQLRINYGSPEVGDEVAGGLSLEPLHMGIGTGFNFAEMTATRFLVVKSAPSAEQEVAIAAYMANHYALTLGSP